MDNFGFENQGSKYEKFRPTYKDTLYTKTIQKLKNKSKYLDIAMGTGQLLFSIAPYFNQSEGVDISDKMLDAAR
jgi:ubiquinone/menaquinone biosynthesis C-methylase UbiE